MVIITIFDNLPDLALIELFSYLSSVDILWAFTCLNDRLTALLAERGFFRHVNLSSVRHHKFDSLLGLLPLNHIESLVIDGTASPLQLIRWPYLPRLTTLILRSVRNYNNVLLFVLLHAATITHVTIESNLYFLTGGVTERFGYSTHHLHRLVKNILLRQLPALRSLDLGTDTTHFIFDWYITAVQIPLTYLRVVLHDVHNLLRIMSTRPLSNTLRQLHVRIRDSMCSDPTFQVPSRSCLPCMDHLHTFTFLKPLFHRFNDEWGFNEALTAPTVMPVLQRANLVIALTVADLNRIDRSTLFNDLRHIDVRYAFILTDDRQHIELSKRIPCGSRSHPRQIASATFFQSSWPDNKPSFQPDVDYIYGPQARQHLWYTLPWAFPDFFQLSVPDRCITQMQVFELLRSTPTIGSSRLLRWNGSGDAVPRILFLPHVLCLDRIEEFHLFYCDRRVRVKLPALRLLTLTNSLDSLHSCSLISTNIRSIIITLYQQDIIFARGNWTALLALSTLPLLSSLRVIMYDIPVSPDDSSCQIIAKTAVLLSDFSFCFRVLFGSPGLHTKSASNEYRPFIEQLRQRILALSA